MLSLGMASAKIVPKDIEGQSEENPCRTVLERSTNEPMARGFTRAIAARGTTIGDHSSRRRWCQLKYLWLELVQETVRGRDRIR